MKILLDKEFKEIKETIEMYHNKYNETLEDYYKAERGHKTIYNNYLDELNKNDFLQTKINKALKFIDGMFDDGDVDKIIDNLLKLEEILKGDENDTTKC